MIDNMPDLRAIACLGEHAWFLTATVLGQAAAARDARRYRDAEQWITGRVRDRAILATSHFHPARGSRAQWSLGWPRLASHVAGTKVDATPFRFPACREPVNNFLAAAERIRVGGGFTAADLARP